LLLVLGEVVLLLVLFLILKLVFVLLVRLVPLGMTVRASRQVTRVSWSLIIRDIWMKKGFMYNFFVWLTLYGVIRFLAFVRKGPTWSHFNTAGVCGGGEGLGRGNGVHEGCVLR
jgi:hypothetical protein